MSDDESFLARWSRRKRGTKPAAGDDVQSAGTAEPAAPPPAADAGALPEAEAPIDPASLPPIDSIGAESDVRAFLEAGVPADLTRAALRRAWSTDPAIRDFIGLSENSWDFNVPGSVGGFGAVTADEVRRLLAHMTEAPAAADPAPPAAEVASTDPAAPGPAQEQARKDDDAGAGGHDVPQCDKENAAMQHKSSEREYTPVLTRRGHGGAVPK
jgi:hypothetical protein